MAPAQGVGWDARPAGREGVIQPPALPGSIVGYRCRRPQTALSGARGDAVGTLLPDGTFMKGSPSICFRDRSSRPSSAASSAGGRPSSASSFRPVIQGKGDPNDLPAGKEGLKWNDQQIEAARSDTPTNFRCQQIDNEAAADGVSVIDEADDEKARHMNLEKQRQKRLFSPKYPRTSIPIGYRGYVPGRAETFGGTYGLRMGQCTPHREKNMFEAATQNVSRFSSTAKAFEVDRLSSPLNPSKISAHRISSPPRERPPSINYIDRFQQEEAAKKSTLSSKLKGQRT